MWNKLSMADRAKYIQLGVANGVTDLSTIRDTYNKYAGGGNLIQQEPPINIGYPEVTIEKEPWADAYFKENTNVSGMAIGEGMNGVGGPRRVIINPYSEGINREAVLKNERLRHYFDETNFKLKNVTQAQMNKYVGTPYEGDTLNIGRTEAARYLTGDKHLISPEQKEILDSLIFNYNKYAEGGPERVHNNTSPTAEASTKLEDNVARWIKGDKRINHAYDIPYIEDKETKIIGYTVPTNALDSIAKYAGKTNFNLEEAVALSFESGYGRQPYYNYGTKNVSDRAVGNMNYFKNYGSIPAHLFVRDYEYTKGGYNKGKPYTDQAPLEHAINFFKSGRYNPKLRAVDPETGKTINHTQKVKLEAKKLRKDPNYQKWKKQSGLDEYTGKAQKARDKQKVIDAENARKAKYREEHPIQAYFKDLFGIKYGGGGPLKEWKALQNIDFEAIPDTTFTRDKTGAGSIEYFQAKYPQGVIYPNGYHKEHPRPGKDVILYNPNENDEQDIRLDALHIMPKDATYDALNTLYRNAARGTDVEWNARQRYEEDVRKYGAENIDPYESYFNNEADGLLRNMFIEGTPEYIKSKRYYPDKEQLAEWNKPLLGHINEIRKYLETGKRPQYILPEVIITAKKEKNQ